MSSTTKLFQPIQVGRLPLKHRVVLAALTRLRAKPVPSLSPLPRIVKEYYTQRASVPGTLLISEGTIISAKAGGYPNAPGIWSEEQITAWKEIVDAVHEKGGFIFLQIAAVGRQAILPMLQSLDSSFELLSASDIPATERGKPRPMTLDEIKEVIQSFADAASNAVHKAGFDGVELHGASGFLIDQFTQDGTNVRTDAYGGSIENRTRFALEVVEAVTKAVGEERTGLKLSPWDTAQDMGMADPIPTFSYLVSKIKDLYPNFAYLQVVEPRLQGIDDIEPAKIPAHESNDFIRAIWSPRPLISAGGYTRATAIETAESKGDIIAFGRHYISNPDLPRRLKEDIPLTPYDRSTFYVPGDTSGKGYIDYPFA